MHASAWFAHRADRGAKALTVLLFFEGAPGWHDKPTDFKWQVNGNPATIDMSVGGTPIHVEYWPNTSDIQIMGHDFKLVSDNVFLVSNIDQPAPAVKGLGSHHLTFSPDDIPPLALLKRDTDVLAALLKEPATKARKQGDGPEPPAGLVSIDRKGLDLITNDDPGDDRRACKLFLKAADRGYAPSQYRLGICYGTGKGVKEDLAAANEWYLKAAQQGHTDAQYKLAHSYRVGRGTPIDLAAALRWYESAAKNGDAQAQYNLGMMYSLGQGSAVDQTTAFDWYLKGAANGDPGSQYEVARRYRDGEGVTKDLKSSYAWLLVLRTQRKSLDQESRKLVGDLLASVEGNLGDDAKVAAQSLAEQSLRDYTKQYLRSLQP